MCLASKSLISSRNMFCNVTLRACPVPQGCYAKLTERAVGRRAFEFNYLEDSSLPWVAQNDIFIVVIVSF